MAAYSLLARMSEMLPEGDWSRTILPGGEYHFCLGEPRPLTEFHFIPLEVGQLGVPINGVDPASIRRPDHIPGTLLSLGDGRQWEIPNLRVLPGSLRYVDGRWKVIPDDAFSSLTRAAGQHQRVIDAICGAETVDQEPTTHDTVQFACELLKLNYILTDEIIDKLDLLTTDSVVEIIKFGSGWVASALGMEHLFDRLEIPV